LHIEVVKINNGADNYCLKEETRIEGPFEFGNRPIKRNSKVDWDLIKKKAIEGKIDDIPSEIYIKHYSNLIKIAKDHITLDGPTDHLKGIWFHGKSGVGKSKKAREDYPNYYWK